MTTPFRPPREGLTVRTLDQYVDPDDNGCWIWRGAPNSGGYGRISVAGIQRHARAHRVVYEMLVGPIPFGLVIDHLCCVPRCVNPDHLEPVTHAENTRRAKALITHCPQGHEYDEVNTYRFRDSAHRICRACQREWHLHYGRKMRAANGAVPRQFRTPRRGADIIPIRGVA